jgi:hypothetical protein
MRRGAALRLIPRNAAQRRVSKGEARRQRNEIKTMGPARLSLTLRDSRCARA